MAALVKREDTNLKPSDFRAALQRSRTIDTGIQQDRERRLKEIQLLVLGPSCSGKTTFIKQLKILYGDGYSQEEQMLFRPAVFAYIRQSLAALLRSLEDHGVDITSSEVMKMAFCACTQISNADALDKTEAKHYTALWEEKVVQDHVTQSSVNGIIPHTLLYFLDNLDRMSEESYTPTIQDILNLRVESYGIQESHFTLRDITYRVIDVAIQHSQRSKWFNLFDGVTAVVFFFSLTSLWEDMTSEDRVEYTLGEVVEQFREVTRCQYFQKSEFILFLNKHDLFLENMKSNPVTSCFPEHTDYDPERIVGLVRDRFMAVAPQERTVYVHVSCATDTSIMRTLLADVMDIIVNSNIKKLAPL